jgi:small subunit ribosomal protein S18
MNVSKNIDYKDVELLKKFLNPHARLMARKRTGLSARHQRKLAEAVKRARFMALLPYIDR